MRAFFKKQKANFKIQVSKLDVESVSAVVQRTFVLTAKSTAMPMDLFARRCVRNMSTITRSLIRTVAVCAGYTP